ncbi:DUF362 domain-containing protein [Fictibacillus fluitans]|uniref:DUF362 domain-containing protein n=1 Tax=Fictibacillus fluitans TaxID=3058422 RepID=A0ABT8I067_9BACL|nr:DUF362 domain-containing protein [Fictibacillus sp. NE201]MDN4526419.1 DUF362 domain-containing protein [Fictibacillus sp. NE201]
MVTSRVPIVGSPLGIKNVDFKGSAISGVRMDVTRAYGGIPILLQKFINQNDYSAWGKIVEKIDYIYTNLNYALAGLEKETSFSSVLQQEVSSGKKLLFKPNIVDPSAIHHETHGEGAGGAITTEWPLVAALMRWFHDNLPINYYQMAIGEASTCTFIQAEASTLAYGKKVTTEATIEGRSGDFYGGWGFFFVRKYLSHHHPPSHKDDPMKGYEESVAGRFIPPGRADDRLMVYDLNKTHNGEVRDRTVAVPGGRNFNEISLHKVIIGGDPANHHDRIDYPGCVLVNIPKPKMHNQDLMTNAIKNLGIGLYSAQKYANPHTPNPSIKVKLPHSRWIMKMDDKTYLPVKDENGKYIAIKTDGFSGTQSDVIRTVQSQHVFMLHIVDAINMINFSHNDTTAVRVPEGYIWTSLDCVALDLFCARYCFKMVHMDRALKLQQENNWPTEFVQYSPVVKIKGRNIKTKIGFDSPLFRYDLYRYAEARGVGQQRYYVVGWDTITKTPLASLKGHLGRIDKGNFLELITDTLYYNRSTILHDLQNAALSYAKANDILTGSTIFKKIMDTFDENRDGVLDYDEKGRGYETARMWLQALSLNAVNETNGLFKSNFLASSLQTKYYTRDWNAQGHDFNKESFLDGRLSKAFILSQSETVKDDLFIQGMMYGNGMWPSWQTTTYITITDIIYGSQSLKTISSGSLYGSAFQYADKVLNSGAYIGNNHQENAGQPSIPYGHDLIDTNNSNETSNLHSINNYFNDLSMGKRLLGFILYVPRGYGVLNGFKIPNVEETDDPDKVFTAHFKVVW